jgi:hypothetical protein
MQREARLSTLRERRDRAFSTLLACRQSSTALRVLLVDDTEDDEDELRKQLARRLRLIMSSFNLEDWSQDGSVRKFRYLSADISQILKLMIWPEECMTEDPAWVRSVGATYLIRKKGLCIVLARLSTVGRWRDMEQVVFRRAGACCEIVRFVVSIFFSQFSPCVNYYIGHSVT